MRARARASGSSAPDEPRRLVGRCTGDEDRPCHDGGLGLGLVVTRPRRTSSESSRRRAPLLSWRPCGGLFVFVERGWAEGLAPRLGVTLWAAARARVAVLPAWSATSCAVLVARVVACLVTLVACEVTLPACWLACLVTLPACWLACLVTLPACLPAWLVTSRVALRPASADLFRTSATWLARLSRAFESTFESWAATSGRTRSRTCSLLLRLRSTKLSTHSCACSRWMSPAFTNSRTISSARPRLTCPSTDPASRYLRMRSLLAMKQEYMKC